MPRNVEQFRIAAGRFRGRRFVAGAAGYNDLFALAAGAVNDGDGLGTGRRFVSLFRRRGRGLWNRRVGSFAVVAGMFLAVAGAFC